MKTLTLPLILVGMFLGVALSGMAFQLKEHEKKDTALLQERSSYAQAYEIAFKSVDCEEFLTELGEQDQEQFTGGVEQIKKDCVHKIIGFSLIGLVFVVILVMAISDLGFWGALGVLGVAVSVTAVLLIGIILITD